MKLNPDTTYLSITGTKQQRNRFMCYFPVKLLGSDTSPSYTVHNLGVVFDSAPAYFSSMPIICSIRRHISSCTAKSISTALISSRLDCPNSLLSNSAKINLAKLQRVKTVPSDISFSINRAIALHGLSPASFKYI